ncbi:hypothetical protein [Lentibacillus saliphilus]|uniref:hypothetical protein n=1 Tax=Lentibacillus saliphilus TaxID=2737028 RepID=UPI001C30FFDF|nr:hypothetical protein [Lentibacillus saliphilus]
MVRVILAGICSLIFPGIGQIYNRQWAKGITFVVVEMGIHYMAPSYVWLVIIFRLIWLYSVIDASFIAYRVHKEKYVHPVYSGRRAMVVVGISMLIILPIAILPTILPNITHFILATGSHDEGGSVEQLEEEKQLYKSYLEETYNETFNLGEESYSANYGHYLIEASPVSDPEVVFGVHQDLNDNFKDYYIDEHWSRDAHEELTPLIENLFKDIWIYDVEVSVRAGRKEEVIDENVTVPTFSEARLNHPTVYYYWVEIFVFQDFVEDQELDKLFDMMTYFQDENIHVTSFEVNYYDEQLKEEEGNDIEPSHQNMDYATHFLSIGEKEVKNIAKPEDIKQFIINLE